MPIIDLQRRLREIGRIRIGQQVPIANPKPNSKTKTRPAKLETFRLTSRDQRVIDAASSLYGGEARPWDEQPGQWEVITATAELPIMVPPGGLALTQWYELWSGGGCLRRCDGENEYTGDQACLCNPEERECSIHTRLSVVLSDLQGLGVWRLDTQGWYAATEIGSVVPLLEGAAERGRFLPARLRLEQRQVLRAGKTNKFAVPVIDIDVTIGQMRSLVSGAGPAAPSALADASTGDMVAIEQKTGLTPVPEIGAGPTVSDQMKTAETPASRARAGTPQLPESGRRPRPRAEAEMATSDKATLGPARSSLDEAAARAQGIVMRCNDEGIPRAHLIEAITCERESGSVTSAKEVTAEEAQLLFLALSNIKRGKVHLIETEDGWRLVDAPTPSVDEDQAELDEATAAAMSAEAVKPDKVISPDFDNVGDEDSWSADQWRAYLTSRQVKVTEAIKEAQRLAAEEGADPPGNLSALKGQTSLCGLLRGWIEEKFEERAGS